VQGLKGVRVGLFCETYPDLRDRQIGKIKKEFPYQIGEVKATQDEGLGFYLNDDNGGGAILLRNLDDPSKYQSAEFAAIAVDELTKNTRETFDILRGSLRYPQITHTIFLAATNPGGIGHLWVKQLWIDRDFPPELAPRADEFIFIKSLPADNPHLTKSYWDELNSLPEDLRRAWVFGDWDVFQGMAFPGWSRDKHVIKPFDIPNWWPRWRSVDEGYRAPFCCLWFAKDPHNGRVYIYREIYQAGMTTREQANVIMSMSPERSSITYADPAMWAKKNVAGIVRRAVDDYAEAGVYLTKADNDRMAGKRKVDDLLMPLEDGKPGLQIFENCRNLIRTLPALPYDDTNPEDVNSDAEDHAYDALRYGLTNTKAAKEKKKAKRETPMASLDIL